jgi:DNA-binding NtrC family response regulator
MPQAPSSPPGHILVVDDDEDVLKAARLVLSRQGMKVTTARDPAEAWSALAADPADVVLLDLNFSRAATSGEEGFQWLCDLIAHDPDAVVVVVTGHSGVNIAVAAMRAGASDFVMKPWRNDRLVATIETALELRRRRREGLRAAAPNPGGETPGDLAPILGDSPAIRHVRSLIARVGATEAAVLVLGDAGTGKSLVARTLHHQSSRSRGPFIALDLEAVDRQNLPERMAAGLRAARGGTLCLEEIGDLSRPAQAELLAALETARNIRLVATTRRRRDQLKGPSGLRDDLLYRLNTVEILVPPLREREGDARLLAEHFLRLFAARYARRPLVLSPEAAAAIAETAWAGEIRGLRQAMERCVILAEGARYELEDVAGPETFESPPAGAGAGLNLAATERSLIARALERSAFNVSHAARQLGLTRAALYRRMAKHGL